MVLSWRRLRERVTAVLHLDEEPSRLAAGHGGRRLHRRHPLLRAPHAARPSPWPTCSGSTRRRRSPGRGSTSRGSRRSCTPSASAWARPSSRATGAASRSASVHGLAESAGAYLRASPRETAGTLWQMRVGACSSSPRRRCSWGRPSWASCSPWSPTSSRWRPSATFAGSGPGSHPTHEPAGEPAAADGADALMRLRGRSSRSCRCLAARALSLGEEAAHVLARLAAIAGVVLVGWIGYRLLTILIGRLLRRSSRRRPTPGARPAGADPRTRCSRASPAT